MTTASVGAGTHPKYRADIDGLRAVAVLSVIGFHAFPKRVTGGFVGVDVFFIISGYLISSIIFGSLAKDAFSFAGFYARRIKRIFPSLIAVLAACCAIGWFVLLPDEYAQLGKHVAGSAAFISNFLLWKEAGYFDVAAETKPLLHLWSLGIEEQFYIVWPLLLAFAWKRRLNLPTVIAVVAIGSFAIDVQAIQHHPVAAFYSPLGRFWELLMGSALAYVALFRQRAFADAHPDGVTGASNELMGGRIADVASVAGCGLIAVAVLVLDKRSPFPGALALIPTAGALLIVAAGPTAWINRRLLAHPVMVWFGLISYPLYLWHWPLLAFARIVESRTPALPIRIVAVGVSIALAWLTYRYIDVPIRFGKPTRAKVLSLSGSLLALACAGLGVYRAGGFSARASIAGYHEVNNSFVANPMTDSACRAFIKRASPLFPYCRFSSVRGASSTVAIIGDSHAWAAFPGLADLYASKGVNLLLMANSNCPPLLGAVPTVVLDSRAACLARIDEIVSLITTAGDINTVLVTTRGATYLTVNGDGGSNDLDTPLQSADQRITLAPEQVFLSGLQRTIDTLVHSGKTVYYIAEHPELAVDPAACMNRPFKLSGAVACTQSLNTVLQRQGTYRALLRNIHGATIVDPMPAFCPGDVCQAFADGMLLYADRNHLSVDGSRFLAQKVVKESVR